MEVRNAQGWAEVVDACNRFPWAIDRGRWEGLERVLAPEVFFDGGNPNWTPGQSPAAALIDKLKAAGEVAGTMQHFVGAPVVDWSEDRRSATCSMYIYLTIVGRGSVPEAMRMGGHYTFEVAVDEAGVKITSVIISSWWRGRSAGEMTA